MKLKNALVLAFLTLTLIPIVAVSLLLYKSGYDLSKESYIRNLKESISVQTDYIVQTIDSNMISDYRFAKHHSSFSPKNATAAQKEELYASFQSYLEAQGDKITICLLLDNENNPIYSIGEESMLRTVQSKLPSLSPLDHQMLVELELSPGAYSLAIVTPSIDENGDYSGCLISVYEKSYLFKVISSYYKIADTSTYICRANGDIVNHRSLSDEQQNMAIESTLANLNFTTEGVLDVTANATPVSGYYKKIGYTPWYLVGFIDNALVSAFTNQYILTYILIIIGVSIADMLLALYCSRRVVGPINSLIQVMEGYPDTMSSNELQKPEKHSYFESRYLRTKFLELMQRISLVQHNFEGVYQLYQSGSMSDTNVDIDTINQTISSNKTTFQTLMDTLDISPSACIVERFTSCFSENDNHVLLNIFENMRDRHLSVPCEIEMHTPYLDEKWFHVLVVPMYENNCLSHLFIQLRDISSFKRHELESSEKAVRDSLTGLYNRAGFTQNAGRLLQTQDPSATHGFFFLDMDYFKMVNDNLGHAAGDDLLRTVGKVLLNNAGKDCIVSRFGGDEFAIFVPNTSLAAISALKAALHEQLAYPYSTDKISFVVTASIGVSIWNESSPFTFEELLARADSAMYQAKKRLKNETKKDPEDYPKE